MEEIREHWFDVFCQIFEIFILWNLPNLNRKFIQFGKNNKNLLFQNDDNFTQKIKKAIFFIEV